LTAVNKFIETVSRPGATVAAVETCCANARRALTPLRKTADPRAIISNKNSVPTPTSPPPLHSNTIEALRGAQPAIRQQATLIFNTGDTPAGFKSTCTNHHFVFIPTQTPSRQVAARVAASPSPIILGQYHHLLPRTIVLGDVVVAETKPRMKARTDAVELSPNYKPVLCRADEAKLRPDVDVDDTSKYLRYQQILAVDFLFTLPITASVEYIEAELPQLVQCCCIR
jgi:hypothetical protein